MNTRIKARLRSLKLCIGCACILGALALTQHQDEIDDQAAQQRAQGQRPVEWIDLEKVADALTTIGRGK